MREIRFRAWDKDEKRMTITFSVSSQGTITFTPLGESPRYLTGYILMQFTGLKDKNGLTEIYEGDIIGVDGLKKGDIYENSNLLKETTNLIIQNFGGKTWCTTYKEALERGCKHSE